jgi:hypothetical protein
MADPTRNIPSAIPNNHWASIGKSEYTAMLAHGAVDWTHVLNGPDIAGIVVAVIAGILLTIWIVASQWRRVRVADSDAGLKIRLVERGYSADDMPATSSVSRIAPGRFREA